MTLFSSMFSSIQQAEIALVLNTGNAQIVPDLTMDVQRQFLVKTLDGFHLGHHTSNIAKKITSILEHQTSQKVMVLNHKISVI